MKKCAKLGAKLRKFERVCKNIQKAERKCENVCSKLRKFNKLKKYATSLKSMSNGAKVGQKLKKCA